MFGFGPMEIGGGAAAAFDPVVAFGTAGANILFYLYDCSDPSTLLATIGGSPAANTAQVLQLSDKSGAGNHATIVGTGPTRDDASVNGQTTLLWTGSQNDLLTPTLATGGLHTLEVWNVYLPTNSQADALWPQSAGGATTLTGVGGVGLLHYIDDLTYAYENDGSASNQWVNQGNTAVAAGTLICQRVTYTLGSPDVMAMEIDGIAETISNFFGTGINTGTYANGAYRVWSGRIISFQTQGNTCFQAMFSRALTGPEAAEMDAWLHAKWGIP